MSQMPTLSSSFMFRQRAALSLHRARLIPNYACSSISACRVVADLACRQILLSVNGNGAFRTREAYVRVNAPGLAKGLHALTLQWVPDGADAAAAYHELAFEAFTTRPLPSSLVMQRPGATVALFSGMR
jgi:hypothetical protein